MELTSYVRKPFDVEATRVTEENKYEIAELVGGEVKSTGYVKENGKFYIDVPVKNPVNSRQKQAYVGDWVVKAQGGWKVYNHRAFQGSFQPNEIDLDRNAYVSEPLERLTNVFQSSAQVSDEDLQVLGATVNPAKRRR